MIAPLNEMTSLPQAPNVQAFIRRASSMADKTSGTNPLARMAYGDCIAGGRQLKGGSRGQRPVGAPPTGGDRGAGRGGGGRWQGGGARWAAGGGAGAPTGGAGGGARP